MNERYGLIKIGWELAVRIYCDVLQNPNADPKTKLDATDDLMRLAKAYTALSDECQRLQKALREMEQHEYLQDFNDESEAEQYAADAAAAGQLALLDPPDPDDVRANLS